MHMDHEKDQDPFWGAEKPAQPAVPPRPVGPRDREIIHAILLGQVEMLREQITGEALFERLWYFAEVLPELIRIAAPGSQALQDLRHLDEELDEISFLQAQHLDLARQTADCVLRALRQLAHGKLGSLTPQAMQNFYVSESQRLVQRQVLERLRAAGPG